MKKYLLTIASLIAVVSLTGFAQLGTALAKSGNTARVTPRAHALSEAAVRADIRSGKLHRVTAQQAAKPQRAAQQREDWDADGRQLLHRPVSGAGSTVVRRILYL